MSLKREKKRSFPWNLKLLVSKKKQNVPRCQPILDQKDEIGITKAKVILMKSQLSTTHIVRSQAFGYGYGAALQRLKSFLIVNSQTNIQSLNLQDLKSILSPHIN